MLITSKCLVSDIFQTLSAFSLIKEAISGNEILKTCQSLQTKTGGQLLRAVPGGIRFRWQGAGIIGYARPRAISP